MDFPASLSSLFVSLRTDASSLVVVAVYVFRRSFDGDTFDTLMRDVLSSKPFFSGAVVCTASPFVPTIWFFRGDSLSVEDSSGFLLSKVSVPTSAAARDVSGNLSMFTLSDFFVATSIFVFVFRHLFCSKSDTVCEPDSLLVSDNITRFSVSVVGTLIFHR